MAGVTTIEARLRVELERRLLSRPTPLPEAVLEEVDDYPALLAKHRWGVVRAGDLVARLQPYTERDWRMGDTLTKVAGARYALLNGLVDAPWVRVLVDDGTGRHSEWRGRHVVRPLMTIIGAAEDLERLALPRTATDIEALLRRQTALGPATDWLLVAALGIDLPAIACWLADLISTNEPAFVALARRDTAAGLHLLADERSRVDAHVRRLARSLRNLYEIARLVELMRSMAGPGRSTAEDLHVSSATSGLTAARLVHDDPGGRYIADGWMHMSTMHAFRQRKGEPLSPAFPLLGYSVGDRPDRIEIKTAIDDAPTFAFYADALRREDIASGTTRTLFDIAGEQPLDFFCGVELMRLGVVALRQIALKSGHRPASTRANRKLLGRLALILLGEVDPIAFDAYATRWSKTTHVAQAGLRPRDLANLLVDPDLAEDVGEGFVVKTERSRRLVAVTPDSAFDPFRWNRRPALDRWRNYHRVATSQIATQEDDGEFRRQVLASVAELGCDMDEMLDGDARVVTEAVAICAAVGSHGTPLARDPKLAVFALRQATGAAVGNVGKLKPKLRIVPFSERKIRSLAARARLAERRMHRSDPRQADSHRRDRPSR